MKYRLFALAAVCCTFVPASTGGFRWAPAAAPRLEAERHIASHEYTLAVRYLRPAAEAGDVRAQLELADLYAGRELPVRDAQLAAVWYTRAAAFSGEAAWKLGRLYENGDGVPENLDLARRYYRIAAERGIAGAQSSLGNLALLEGDYPAAMSWYRLSANGGYADAMLNLAGMYYHGLGVARDTALALEWARRGEKLKAPDAAAFIAQIERGE